ncbi:hypothetical protein [Streptomyces sp.]|uniref:hypothetical protein n=1 Tax=Streptomyces sp. TaxID=1931 RepID=UPI002F409CCE
MPEPQQPRPADPVPDQPARLVRVEIDPNIRAPLGGYTRARLEDADGPLTPGQDVTVYESESGLTGPGRVTRIDRTNQLVYLAVDWWALREEPAPAPVDPALRQRVARILDDAGGTYANADADTLADVVLAALRPELERAKQAEQEVARLTDLLGQYADRAIENGQRAAQAEAALARVRDAAHLLADGTEAGCRASIAILDVPDAAADTTTTTSLKELRP